jgi:hypothetical protein
MRHCLRQGDATPVALRCGYARRSALWALATLHLRFELGPRRELGDLRNVELTENLLGDFFLVCAGDQGTTANLLGGFLVCDLEILDSLLGGFLVVLLVSHAPRIARD